MGICRTAGSDHPQPVRKVRSADICIVGDGFPVPNVIARALSEVEGAVAISWYNACYSNAYR